MKFPRLLGASLSVFALLLVSQAFASGKGRVSITLTSPTHVSGKVLPAGDYLVKWKSDNPGGEAAFYENGKEIADVHCKVVERGTKAENDEVITGPAKDGGRVIEEIHIAGKTSTLVFS